ncbi:uncharacterized protein Z518_05374 [Rhinocladiella mackenziei CBS 650.93]|uniref:Peptidase S33 tripeptidyl aminopeptidase-like C-terminal domain-containing protein n=1 Tax=Rhinocladiella mackenziei CBS 650.93 TaxID=1442369 RepID=A0A0D2IFD5_9EURO|nr:uncharacterized protein Z518_05374 [Rhinocladiella mackenziei CBS 650.93]KIX04504.1 hypothetical protein Z518_05374 [Rhinocladiella mackenziei CBS 650.93]
MFDRRSGALTEKIVDSNVQIPHGQVDKIAPVSSAERLHPPLEGNFPELCIFDDTGHVLTLERFDETMASLEELVDG